MGYSEDTKGVFRRFQRGIQKIPKGYSEDNKGVFRRYQRGIQKITKGFRRYQRGIQKITKGYSEAVNRRTENTMAKRKRTRQRSTKHY